MTARRILAAGLVLLWAVGSATAQPQSFGLPRQGLMGNRPRASLHPMLHQDRYRPGDEVKIAFEITVQQGYHIQAHEPGIEFLIGTELRLTPPDGLSLGAPVYPRGVAHDYGEAIGTAYEYKGKTIVYVAGRVAADAKPGRFVIKGRFRYQACKDGGTCDQPVTVPFSVPVPVVEPDASVSAQYADVFAGMTAVRAAPSESPTPAEPADRAGPSTAQTGTMLPWEPFSGKRLEELTARGRTVLVDFTAEWCINCRVNEALAMNTAQVKRKVLDGRVATLRADWTQPNPQIEKWLRKLKSGSVPLTVIFPGRDPSAVILLRDSFLEPAMLAALDRAGPSVELPEPRPGVTLATALKVELGYSIWSLLGLAFIGGLLLNVMPCVLPVVSIKVLSLVQQGGQDRARVTRLGLVFCLGMMLVFWVLATLAVAAGLLWGQFFQSKAFLVGMAGLLTAMGLSLFGVFTVGLPGAVGDAAAAAEREGYLASLSKGALAVLLGTPCSAPLLGPALGGTAAAVEQHGPWVAYLLFTAIGLGMASPFLLLAWRPGWVRFIPKPGPWMETFKQAMGFVLLATVVYLLSILPETWTLWTVLFCLVVGLAAWVWGRWVNINASPFHNWAVRVVSLALLAAGAWVCFGYFAAAADHRAALVDRQLRQTTPSVPASLAQAPPGVARKPE